MYKNVLLILLITSLSLFAYSDYDMDGVDDKIDQCPNTPFEDLVDEKGCSIKSLESPHHFDVIFGIDFSQTSYETMEKTDTITNTLQVDYYYKDFSLQASSSYYKNQSDTYNNNGLDDSFIGAYYKLTPLYNLTIRLGAGLVLPTYNTDLNNNNTDYTASANLSYMLENINIFGGIGYTIINDDDINGVVAYKNTNSYSIGLGFYPTQKLYLSSAYNSNESIYEGVEDLDTLSIYGFYSIDSNWFTSFSYAYGLTDSASDNSVSFRVGYYF
ncbi:MAG: DUF3187 domain-containing protein [Sulfurimonadaceae bacterium]|jgi:hypothetical protein|nr:DUF3187 domain-containing protein [Sulfurimonadaceae bacterium]